MELKIRVVERLAAMRELGMIRTLRAPAGVDLCSNDYLQLAQHVTVKNHMAAAVQRDGCGSTGSRLLRGERQELSALERRFADFKGSEAAVYFSSGFLANIAVLSTFLETGDVVFSDSLNHASLIDGIKLGHAKRVVFPHSDSFALSKAMRSAEETGQPFIVVESIFSMDGDCAPLSDYAAIAEKSAAMLIVDEAHAVGVYGVRGSGLIEGCDISRKNLISINPMGKAFGASGAFVCGPGWAIEYLVQCARPFMFSTAPPPAVASALHAALDLVKEEPERRQRVLSLAGFLRQLLFARGWNVSCEGSQIIPILIGDNVRAITVATSLQEQGFDVRAIRPPAVSPGTARLRISINCGLTEEILERFVDALGHAVEQYAAS